MANTSAIIAQIGVYLNTAFRNDLNANFEALKAKDVQNYNELVTAINQAIGAIQIITSSSDVTNASVVQGETVTDALNSLRGSLDSMDGNIITVLSRVDAAETSASTTAGNLSTHTVDNLRHISTATSDIYDTSGASLSNLEIDVNKIKEVLRHHNLIVTS